MKTIIKIPVVALCAGALLVAVGCDNEDDGNTTSTSSTEPSVLDRRCDEDSDCPSDYNCRQERGTSYCLREDGNNRADNVCPPGFELDEKGGFVSCKPSDGD